MILVECNPDEALVMCLGLPQKLIKHHQGKYVICSELTRKLNGSVGLIEEDNPGKHQPLYLQKLKSLEAKFDVSILWDSARSNKIVMIKPFLEIWVINIVNRQRLKMTDYGLPNLPKDLRRVINERMPQFKTLIDVLNQQNEPSLQFLKTHLNFKK